MRLNKSCPHILAQFNIEHPLHVPGAQMEVDYTEKLNFSDDEENQAAKEKGENWQVFWKCSISFLTIYWVFAVSCLKLKENQIPNSRIEKVSKYWKKGRTDFKSQEWSKPSFDKYLELKIFQAQFH